MSTTTETREISYGRRLTELAAERPDDADLIVVRRDGSEQAITYARLEARSNQIARAMQALGVDTDDFVGLALPSCIEHIEVTMATWKLGATLLPLRHDMPQWEMDRLLQLAEPKVLISEEHHWDGCPVLKREDLAATISLSSDPLEDRISECVNLLASSGSTGTPKLIVRPSRGVIADDPLDKTLAGDDEDDSAVVLVASPLYHVNGFKFAAPYLLERSKVYVMEKFDAAQAVELIRTKGITYTVMVPTMLQRIAQLDDLSADDLASMRRLIYGGAKVPEWVVDKWLDLLPDPSVFTFTYGSSEGLGLIAMSGAEWKDHHGSTGRPQFIGLSIRDEDGNEVPTGEVGTIYMKPEEGSRVFSYIGIETPEPTPDGYWTIGDLGSVDADGYLTIADRRTDMIITGGANVFPAEVETALSEHPAVVDQVVIGIPDDEWGHRVHAIIACEPSMDTPTSDQLKAHCKERLASYKVPKTFEIVDTVPRTEAGKLNRTNLAKDRTTS